MTNGPDPMGPIDYVIIEFPRNRMTGEGLRILVGLVDNGIIRVLDLIFVRKDTDGAVTVVDVADLDGDGTFDLTVFAGASSGLLLKEDLGLASEVLRAGTSAVILLYENRWAAPMVVALRNGGAELVAGGRIPLTDLMSILDIEVDPT